MEQPEQKHNPSKNKNLRAPRAWFHDYHSSGYYLITITTHKGSPALSTINDKPNELRRPGAVIIPENTPLGDCVQAELLSISKKHPQLQIKRYVIMPDHIHFILLVTSRLDKPLGRYIAPFTTACSQAYRQLFGLTSFTTLFQPFDDRIIFNYPQLDRAYKYIIDNPRRYLIRRQNPNLFRRHLHITIDNHEYAAYGNIFLLNEIYLLPIRIHRRWSPEEFEDYAAECRNKIAMGALPISPAIHKSEKEIIWSAVKSGSKLILLRDLSFNERFKPQGELFNLCASGRLLLLSPWPENLNRRSDAGYAEFHKMNDLAVSIAGLPASARLILNE